MIVQLKGKIVGKGDHALILDVMGICYEVLVPLSVLQRVEDSLDANGQISLIIYQYLQLEPSRGIPVLVGFINEIEKEFFLQFIKVSGIGPRAAVKALNRSISEISRAIDAGDIPFLKSLPGIGLQRAKDIVAKLQGKVGKYALIRDQATAAASSVGSHWQEEALEVLMQLQYKRPEAMEMIHKALARSKDIHSAEDLLNEIYKQKINV